MESPSTPEMTSNAEINEVTSESIKLEAQKQAEALEIVSKYKENADKTLNNELVHLSESVTSLKKVITYISHEVEEKRNSARLEKEAAAAEASVKKEQEEHKAEHTEPEPKHTFSEILINAANGFAHEFGVLSTDVTEHKQFSEASDNNNSTEHHN